MSRFNPDYVEKCGTLWLVYKWSPEWNRYVNTHAYPEDMEAEARRSCRKYDPNYKSKRKQYHNRAAKPVVRH